MSSLASIVHRAMPIYAWAPKGYREMMAMPRNARLSMKDVQPALFKVEDFDWGDVYDINEKINRTAKYHKDDPGTDTWGPWRLIDGVRVGDCEDFAVHKLQFMMANGYDRGALRLAICLTEHKELHCVLLMYLSDGDAIILDNRNKGLWRKSKYLKYTWLSEEWPGHGFWWRKLT
ncbi:hypothetical protein LCGC14_1684790 [marine sediment metagenome]|uniref:Transglutaminase-like domain-containing protein n=1 Tax=marine sediment metagenome TaxID=412755 RepID=A0A0F9HMQ4_9ZZZZ